MNAEEHYQEALRLLERSDLPDYSAADARDMVAAAQVHAQLAAYRAANPQPVVMDLGDGRRIPLAQWISGAPVPEEDSTGGAVMESGQSYDPGLSGACVLDENDPELMFRDGGANEVTDDFGDGKLWADLWTAIHAADPSSVPNPERLTTNSLWHEARVLAAYKAVKDYGVPTQVLTPAERRMCAEMSAWQFRRRAAEELASAGEYGAAVVVRDMDLIPGEDDD